MNELYMYFTKKLLFFYTVYNYKAELDKITIWGWKTWRTENMKYLKLHAPLKFLKNNKSFYSLKLKKPLWLSTIH